MEGVMERRRYVNIDIDGEGNIGIIDLGVINYMDKNIEKIVRDAIEPKLIQALESHFDVPVKVRLTEVISTLGHVEVRVTVVVESEEEDREETVTLEETWIY